MLRRRLLAVAPYLLVSLVASAAAAGIVFGLQERALDRAYDEAAEARATADELRRDAAASEAEARLLREHNDELQTQVVELSTDLDSTERQIALLQGQMGESGTFAERITNLTEQLARLQGEHQELVSEREQLTARMDSLVPIRTPELQGDVLYLDRSVPGVTYSGAVCSGSMEPNITCEDLLVLYEPRVTDLDVGDVIYYRKQRSDCSGPEDGRYMLHRISRVLIASNGVAFETKGDALSSRDRCIVPAEDVLYKLLTTVRNGRIVEQTVEVNDNVTTTEDEGAGGG